MRMVEKLGKGRKVEVNDWPLLCVRENRSCVWEENSGVEGGGREGGRHEYFAVTVVSNCNARVAKTLCV